MLLLHQLIESSPLFRRKHCQKLAFRSLNFLAQFRRNRFHNLNRACLAFLQDLVNSFPLLRLKNQFALSAPQELEPNAPC